MSAVVRALEPEPIAPWAETVPGAPPMTMAEFLDVPDDSGWRYELVDHEGQSGAVFGRRNTSRVDRVA